jgi:hypothetical protein
MHVARSASEKQASCARTQDPPVRFSMAGRLDIVVGLTGDRGGSP